MYEVHVREEVDFLVVDGLLELPVLVGIFGVHANNYIRNLSIVADTGSWCPPRGGWRISWSRSVPPG
jgi:hypothetical protein